MRYPIAPSVAAVRWLAFAALAVLLLAPVSPVHARPTIRASFFSAYPTAVGTRLDNLPSISGHCGVCHFKFTGGGARNSFGVALGDTLSYFPNTDAGRQQAVMAIKNFDSDGDGVIQDTEILDHSVLYSNTPTFPGLNATNVSLVSDVNVNDILAYLTPTTGGDTTPPSVTVNAPNGGEAWTAQTPHAIAWLATDNTAVTSVDVYYRDGAGQPWTLLGKDLPNSGSIQWFVTTRRRRRRRCASSPATPWATRVSIRATRPSRSSSSRAVWCRRRSATSSSRGRSRTKAAPPSATAATAPPATGTSIPRSSRIAIGWGA
jgi:hypothetical protein